MRKGKSPLTRPHGWALSSLRGSPPQRPPLIQRRNPMSSIQKILYKYKDEKYGDFLAKLVPTQDRRSFIGIRSPNYKSILKEVYKLPSEEIETFLKTVPHEFHEENVLHISIINNLKDYDECVAELEHFMPYVTNWAVSDGLKPSVFIKNKNKIIKKIECWIKDPKPYTKRCAILLLMKFFLDEEFNPAYLEWPAAVRSDEYYVNMMIAWFFAEALVKQWNSTITYITSHRLDTWTHNKAIQKARESFRITPEQKEYLNTLKIKTPRGKK